MSLLKQETGIDVKSASSSIEEIVARQFVERHARKRQIVLPPGRLFADTPASKKPAKPGKAAPEPPKSTTPPRLPRLVKSVRPLPSPVGTLETPAVVEAPPPPPPPVPEPIIEMSQPAHVVGPAT